MSNNGRTMQEVQAENKELRLRLEELEEMLGAIKSGEVDAVVVETPYGNQIFTLEGAEHPYRVLVESMNEGAAILAPDGTILYCNRSFARLLNINLEKIIGTQLRSYVFTPDKNKFEGILERCRNDQGAGMLRLVTGVDTFIRVRFSCRQLEMGGTVGMSAVITDLSEKIQKDRIIATQISELEKTSEELQEKEHMLLLQNRFAAMGEMISNIAHQWRQPLNRLGLTVQHMRLLFDMERTSQDALYKDIDSSLELIRHMSQTIDDFRNFFRPDKEKTTFNVDEIIHKSLKLLEAVLEDDRIEIDHNLSEGLMIYGYPNEYSQVILNILTNAKDAFEERKPEHPKIQITASQEAGKYIVRIRDNAGGIPEPILGKIFEPFFSTKGFKGTGIGLFMAKNIVERSMNGRLGVRNVGDGAEFTIEV